MITYNHEAYIEQAVRGVMMQETDFEYELIIGEDCSTDNTRDVVLRLKEEFPDKIRLILHPQNVGMMQNFIDVYDAADGNYIALCEGDDYWTSEAKLQKQVNFLKEHPECSICFHKATVIDDTGKVVRISKSPSSVYLDSTKVLFEFYIMTASVLLRHNGKRLPSWFNQLRGSGDWVLYAWIIQDNSKIGYLNSEPLSVYRKHDQGITYQPNLIAQKKRRIAHIHDIDLVRNQLQIPKHKKILRIKRLDQYISLAYIYRIEGNMQLATKYANYSVRDSFLLRQEILKSVRVLLRTYLNTLWSLWLKLRRVSQK